MTIADRTVQRWAGGEVIVSGNRYLYVEKREFYTRYTIKSHWVAGQRTGRWIELQYDVRNCEPLPNCKPRIIYARSIPWFLWIWYGIKYLSFKVRWWIRRRRSESADKKRAQKIREYQARVIEQSFVAKNRFGGRYK
jgi:hypothetical protein